MSLFAGLSGIADSILGDPVTFTHAGGPPRVIRSILRRAPVRAIGPDGGDVLVTAPSWRVRRDLAPEVQRDDRVEGADGAFRVLNVWPQGSPAADAHLICELEALTA